jgi:hypothetical protein
MAVKSRHLNELGESETVLDWEPTPEEIAAMCKQIRAENEAREAEQTQRTLESEERIRQRHSQNMAERTMKKLRKAVRRHAERD